MNRRARPSRSSRRLQPALFRSASRRRRDLFLVAAAALMLAATVVCAALGFFADGQVVAVAGGFAAVLAAFALVQIARAELHAARRRRQADRALKRAVDFSEVDLLGDVTIPRRRRGDWNDEPEAIDTRADRLRGWPDLRERRRTSTIVQARLVGETHAERPAS